MGSGREHRHIDPEFCDENLGGMGTETGNALKELSFGR